MLKMKAGFCCWEVCVFLRNNLVAELCVCGVCLASIFSSFCLFGVVLSHNLLLWYHSTGSGNVGCSPCRFANLHQEMLQHFFVGNQSLLNRPKLWFQRPASFFRQNSLWVEGFCSIHGPLKCNNGPFSYQGFILILICRNIMFALILAL